MRVAGFFPNPSRENNNLISVCREFFYFFEIIAPEQVSFSATATNQRCFGTNDGTIQITASGGSGSYEYILNGNDWNNAQRFTAAQSPISISGLAPNIYNIQVRDSNGCLDRASLQAQPKVERLSISAVSQITHTINQSTSNPLHTGAPEASDGQITIASLAGGTPSDDIQGAYFEYQVLLNGITPSTFTGRAYLNIGFHILGLPAGNHSIRYTDANSCTRTLDLPTISDPAPITFTLQQSAPSCADANDGELRITNIAGGYLPYIIEWRRDGVVLPNTSEILTGGVGNYSLRITDTRSGVAVQENITFANVPPPLTFTEQVSPIQCFGGLATVTITARGGVPPYEYGVTEDSTTNWYTTNTIELPASFVGYRFQVRQVNNATCVAAASNLYRISEPEEFFIDAISVTDNTIFQGNQGAIRIVVIGDTAPYSVTWRKQNDPTFSAQGESISGLTTGYYIPTITDNTGVCTIQGAPIFVNEPEELLVNIDATSNPIQCFGDTGGLQATATGGSENYSYRWFRNSQLLPNETTARIQNYIEGNYNIEVNDGFTTANASVALVEPTILVLAPLTGTNISCYNDTDGTISLQPTGGTPPYAFSIDNRQTYTALSSLNNNTIVGLAQGSYNIWLRDSNGCEIAAPQSIILTQPSDIVIAEADLQDVTTLGGNDGLIEIVITGGTGTYKIDWTKDEDVNFQARGLRIADLTFGTYTAFVSDANSCVTERRFTVREPLPMNVQITQQADVLCHEDATAQLLATVTGGYPIESTPADFEYQWFMISGTTVTTLNTDFNLDLLDNLPTGTYRVDVNDVKGATASTTFQVTQPDDLQAVLEAAPIDVLCYGEATGQIAITVTGGPRDPDTGAYLPYTYAWEKQDDASFTASAEDLSNLTAGRYTVTVTDANLCTVRIENIPITQPEAPLAVATQDVQNLTGFQTENGSITIEITGGTTPYNYSWTKAEDAGFFADTPDISGLSIGTYMLVVTDAHNCTLRFEQTLTEPEQLLTEIISLSLAESVQCFGDLTEAPLRSQTTGGVPPYSYQWRRQDAPEQVLYTTANTPLVLAGTYILQVTDANGNITDTSYTVAQPSALQLIANVTDLLCHNDTDGRIDITVTGGVPPYSYQWSNGETTEDLSGLRAGDYSVRVQDSNGCILEDTISVNHPRALAVGVDRVFPSALGLSDGRITLNVFGGTPPYNYQWRDSSGTVVAITQNILNDTGIEKYAATVTDANNCTVFIDDVDLFEPPVLEVFIDPISVVSCFGNTETGQLTAVVEGGIPFNAAKQYNYAWFNATTSSPFGTDAITLTTGAGSYYVEVTDVLGTTRQSAVFTLEQPELLEVQLTTEFINCGDANDWTIETIVTGGTPPYQYAWQTSETTAVLHNVIPDSYTLEVTDQRGCTRSATITITPPPTLEATLESQDPICFNSCDGAVVLNPQGGTPPYSYQWSTGATTKDIVNACADLYTVSITDAKGCNIEREMLLVNPEQPIIDLGDDVTLCKDQTLLLDARIDDANASYLWVSDNGFTATTPRVELSDTGNYTVTVTDVKGCTASDTVFIQATTAVIVTDFIGSSQVFVDEHVLLFDISDPLPNGLQWEFSEGTTIHYQDNDFAEVSFSVPGTYTVNMKATFGLCEDIRTKTIVVVEPTYTAADGEGGTQIASGINANIFLKTYPNPAPSAVFTVEIDLPSTQDVSVKIYGIGSNIPIATKRGTAADYYKFDYNLQRMPSGLYFILLETISGDQVHKLVIE